jgi:hypothetical protein
MRTPSDRSRFWQNPDRAEGFLYGRGFYLLETSRKWIKPEHHPVLYDDELDALIFLQERGVTAGLIGLKLNDARLIELRALQNEAAEQAALDGGNIEMARAHAGERVVLKFLAFQEKKTWAT